MIAHNVERARAGTIETRTESEDDQCRRRLGNSRRVRGTTARDHLDEIIGLDGNTRAQVWLLAAVAMVRTAVMCQVHMTWLQ